MKRRDLVVSSATAALAALWPASPVFGQAFPNRPVRFVVPFPAGTSPDVVARIISDKLAPVLGQPVLIENRAGAAGGIAADFVARSPADGHTMLFAVASVMTITPHVNKELKYQPLTDFHAVVQPAIIPYVLCASPNAPFNTMAELVAEAKKKPGGINYASAGIGSQLHVAIEIWSKQLGIKLNHIPYSASADADLMAGLVSLILNPATNAVQLVKAGKIKAIAVSTERRLPSLPNVPTASEFMPGLSTVAWHGVFAPKGTPAAVIAKVNTEVLRIMALPEVSSRLADMGLLIGGGSPEEFGAAVATEHAAWGRAIRELNIKLE
jgi:tripartite-type tricarboxylate transporter receptor subunit TctC